MLLSKALQPIPVPPTVELLKIISGVAPHPVAVQDVELPNFLEGDRRKGSQGEIDDLLPQVGRHALTPSGRGIGRQVDHMLFETVIERRHEQPFGLVPGHAKK